MAPANRGSSDYIENGSTLTLDAPAATKTSAPATTTSFMDNMLNFIGQHRRLLIALALGVLVFFIVLPIIMNSTKNPTTCQLSTSYIGSESAGTYLAKDPKNTVMISSSGYVYFYGLGFLPLKLSSLSVDTSHGIVSMYHQDDCADINLNYDKGWSRTSILSAAISSFHLNNGENLLICRPKIEFAIYNNERFSCRHLLAFTCTLKSETPGRMEYVKPIAHIVFTTLEIEFDGNLDSWSKGKFSKQTGYYSCLNATMSN